MNQSHFSMGEAARRLGLSKPTVSSKIKKGLISATQLDDGSYRIEGAELARFEQSYQKPARGKKRGEAPSAKRVTPSPAHLAEVELTAARVRISELEADRDRLRSDLEKAQQRLDAVQDKLADIAAASVARGQLPLWKRLLGKD
jgi:excisionase family DNA binding protein